MRVSLEHSAHVVKHVRLYWHRNPGSLRMSRKCRKLIEWFWVGPSRKKGA